MPKYTPGPRIVKRFDNEQTVVLGPDKGDGRREMIAVFTGPHQIDDALLDAAAPYLLEACKEVISDCRVAYNQDGSMDEKNFVLSRHILKQIDAIIAKAEPKK